MTERAKFEIVGDLLCEWTDKCTCGGYCEPYWMHEKGCGLEPVIPLDQLDKLLTPPKVYFPGDTVPAGVHTMADEFTVFVDEGEPWSPVHGPHVEITLPTREEWQATVDRAKAERLCACGSAPVVTVDGRCQRCLNRTTLAEADAERARAEREANQDG